MLKFTCSLDCTTYLTTSSKTSKKESLIKMLSADLSKNDHKLKLVIARLQKCGSWVSNSYTGYGKRYCCMIPFCPYCIPRIQKAERRCLMKNIRSIAEVKLKNEDFTYVTINISNFTFGSSIREASLKFKRALDYRIRTSLPGSFAHGVREIASGGDGFGNFHAHLIVYHPAYDRTEVKSALRKSFHKVDRDVYCQRFNANQSVYKNIKKISDYNVKAIKQLPKEIAEEFVPPSYEWGLIDIVRSWASLWSGGMRGIRIQHGFKKRSKIDKVVRIPNRRGQRIKEILRNCTITKNSKITGHKKQKSKKRTTNTEMIEVDFLSDEFDALFPP